MQNCYTMTSDVENLSTLERGNPGCICDPLKPVLVRSLETHEPGLRRNVRAHPRGQLLWAENGILRVHACGAHWLVPTSHAVWIRGETEHEVIAESGVSACFIYIDPSVLRGRASACEVVHMTPLMQHLVRRFRQISEDEPESARAQRMAQVIIDELTTLPEAPLRLPAGTDPRLQRVTNRLMARPEDRSGLEEMAQFSGTGARTLERLFQRETGLKFSEWRSRLRLMEAVNHLSHGKSSAEIAARLGYRSASAFVAAFRRSFGVPPQSYLKAGRGVQAGA
ncbi:AraC family transcriptional regulator [Martelella mediterranea]|uniref:AraC family transcriptional regulator n=2 Tax=Martelella mediterranea TaxID=293089 RepID=A0A4R3NY75_9HYPH|nr:AraC family transcriptional regulator [Martelella mediterranea]